MESSADTVEQPAVVVYTTAWCSDCEALKRTLDKWGVPFEEVDIEHDEDAARHVQEVNGGRRSVPTVVAGETAESFSNFSRARLHAFLEANALASKR